MNLRYTGAVVIGGLLISVAAGCASSGKRFDASKVPMIVAGETTQAEIREFFGEPKTYYNRNASGKREMWQYVYVSVTLLGAESRALTITFDKNNVVKSLSYQEH